MFPSKPNEKFLKAFTQDCPECGVKAGQSCVFVYLSARTGEPMNVVHTKRIEGVPEQREWRPQ